jgi:ATP-grasp domain, R2K clade family 3
MIENKNSLLYWFPKVKDLGIAVPKTHILLADATEFRQVFDGEELRADLVAQIKESASVVGYPLFLRTDLQSGKHGWKNTCYVEDESRLLNNALGVVEENEIGACFFGASYQALVFREFLALETSFVAFYGDMPVNKERRYFIEAGKIRCHHPYWPSEAIAGHTKDSDWLAKLAALNEEKFSEITLLRDYALRVSAVLPEFWSVDFAKAKDGTWYLIDMALGHESYHWPTCPAI